MDATNLLTALSNLADATRMAEGPGLLSSYERAEQLAIISDATEAVHRGAYSLCALHLCALDGAEAIRLGAMAIAFDEAEEAFDARNEQTPNYQGRSGL